MFGGVVPGRIVTPTTARGAMASASRRVYTKTGRRRKTTGLGRWPARFPKTRFRIETFGTVDELNRAVRRRPGAGPANGPYGSQLRRRTRTELFHLGMRLVRSRSREQGESGLCRTIEGSMCLRLRIPQWIIHDVKPSALPLTKFLLSRSGSAGAAAACTSPLCGRVCRRAEVPPWRSRSAKEEAIGPFVIRLL
jgi:cob(I)alamin adenosyltransferase